MQAVIVAFRGSEPTNLINLRSAGRISMTPRRGLGRVHDGFFGALFFTGDEEAGTLFSRLIETIQAIDPENSKQLYLTGNFAMLVVAWLQIHGLHRSVAWQCAA